jgi:subtilase family serine protease
MRLHSARSRNLRRGLVLLGATALSVSFAATSGYAASPDLGSHSRTAVPGTAATWTSRADAIGAPRATTSLSFNVVLPLRDAAGAARFAAAVSDSKSASYGHYLTPKQFNARYAPTAAQVRAVRSYLKGQGFAISGVAQGNRWISVRGTVRQVEQAFDATLKTYRYQGRTLRASATPLSVPASMSGRISGFVGISQSPSLRHPLAVSPAPDRSFGPADAVPPRAACSVFWDQNEQIAPLAYGRTSFPTNNCGYSPAQLRSAYGVQSAVSHGDTGRGITVAIIDAYGSPTILADANAYSDLQGEPEFAAGQYTETLMTPFDLQGECGPDGWNEEETLDVEAVHGLAPGANVHYIGAQDCDTGIDAAVNYVLQNHVANIVSNSYGFAGEDGLGAEVALEHSQFTQAAIEGIGFYYSTGDDGDNVAIGAPHPEPDFPATDPLVTAVGGTSLAVNSHNGYLFETSWGDDLDSVNFATSPSSYSVAPPGSFLFGGGGGVSALFAEPLYQRLAVPNSLAKLNGPTAMRVIPDVAAVGDPETGFLILFRGTPTQIGGTSLACPVFAGIQALASQGRRFPIGFANPLLYVLNLSGATFHDVQAPTSTVAMMTQSGRSLLTMGQDSSLTSTRRYDDTTGLGTPNGPGLLLGEKLLP